MDQQLCRIRLERPMTLDLPELADNVIKNNMGIGGIELRVRGTLADGTATLIETGQKLPVLGGPARSTQPWLWFECKPFGLGHDDGVTWLRETPQPADAPDSRP
jgi:hypothetical protein